ncbi:MAG: FtsH protease activity modulator HflK, partial [Gammaproteobacteria bacterium]|nr:FtsH protease activity modulator HflK [Gammaproteobacteria bacterium]
GNPGGEGGQSGGPELSGKLVGLILGVVGLIWLASGIYIIEPAERGIVLQFGAFQKVTDPGPNWHIPFPVESVVKINVDQLRSLRHKAMMLTRDENIVDVELTVQSRIEDAADYLFQDRDPDKTIQDATESAVREVVGKNKLDFILTEGRSVIATQIQDSIQALLTQYKTGLVVTSVNMQPAKPPEAVKASFDDAIKAREDKERQENEAQAYANEVVPKARGAAARRLADASAYRDQRIAEAEGEADRFSAVLTAYEKAPKVTRERLYLETVEAVMSDTGKVILDVKNGNNLTYLPIDRIIDSNRQAASSKNQAAGMSMPTAQIELERPLREDVRGRRER